MDLNTPIQQLEFKELDKYGVQLDVKRDDLIHPLISGNKWRKLKYNVSYAQLECLRGIHTFGGAYSNHLIATACACASHGLKSKATVRGDELKRNSNFVLRLCHEYGMELKFVSRQEYRDLRESHTSETRDYYLLVPEGGSNERGIMGCEEIAPSAKEYAHIVLGVGTATTMAGLVRSNNKAHVHGISAVGDVSHLNDRLRSLLGSKENWTLQENLSASKFGKLDREVLELSRSVSSQTGILFDPIYTSRVLWAVIQLCERGEFQKGQRILMIHTGGMTGILSDKWLNYWQ